MTFPVLRPDRKVAVVAGASMRLGHGLAKAIKFCFGRSDLLVDDAGLGDIHPADDVTEDDRDAMMQIDLKEAGAMVDGGWTAR